jgi:integrase/recombinase XerD
MYHKPFRIPNFKSVLAPLLSAFMKEKIACGCKYEGAGYDLKKFDAFLFEAGLSNAELPQAMVEQFILDYKRKAPGSYFRIFGVIRQFALFMYWQGYEVFIPNADHSPRKYNTFAPYIFTHDEIRRLFVAVDNLPVRPNSPRRHIVMPEIFRLYYGCGLRLREALDLTVENVDLQQGVLTIRNSKFKKDRLVPLVPELTSRLRILQKKLGRRKKKASFFPAPDKGFYGSRVIYDTFRLLLWESRIPHKGRGKGPRIHDMRHTFAVHRMVKWYQEGVCLNAKLPILSTYLGHRNLGYTQRYLHLTLELFADLSARLDKKFDYIIPRRAAQ